jgi:hypothetical protein
METVIAIFMLGVAVTLVVAKGLLQARDFAKAELEKLKASGPTKVQCL